MNDPVRYATCLGELGNKSHQVIQNVPIATFFLLPENRQTYCFPTLSCVSLLSFVPSSLFLRVIDFRAVLFLVLGMLLSLVRPKSRQ